MEGWAISKLDCDNANLRDKQLLKFVKCVPHLKYDIAALMKLTAKDDLPDVLARASNSVVIYLVGDTSGWGFGCCLWLQGQNSIRVDFRMWTTWLINDMSSNYKEATNLVFYLKRMMLDGKSEQVSEIFLFTDNGLLHSSMLHQMIVDLRKLKMSGDLVIYFIWILGKRMIAQGTNGLSRADLSSGVMGGQRFLTYLTLKETASVFERTNQVMGRLEVEGSYNRGLVCCCV